MRIETRPDAPLGVIFYILDPLAPSVRSETRFVSGIRTIVFEELGVDSAVRFAPVPVLPYGEDASLVLQKNGDISKGQADRIAARVRSFMQTEFLRGDMYYVSVRCLRPFGPCGLPVIDEAAVKGFRRRSNTKVIVAALTSGASVPVLWALKALGELSASYKYAIVEYDDATGEMVRYALSNRVSDRIAIHLQSGGGTVVYE